MKSLNFYPHEGVPLQHRAGQPASLLPTGVSLRGRPEGGRDEADRGAPREADRVGRAGQGHRQRRGQRSDQGPCNMISLQNKCCIA